MGDINIDISGLLTELDCCYYIYVLSTSRGEVTGLLLTPCEDAWMTEKKPLSPFTKLPCKLLLIYIDAIIFLMLVLYIYLSELNFTSPLEMQPR